MPKKEAEEGKPGGANETEGYQEMSCKSAVSTGVKSGGEQAVQEGVETNKFKYRTP